MKKSDENKAENCTIVNGVVLTEKAIKQLKNFQEHNNEQLKEASRTIADAVCLIARHHDDISADDREAVDYLMFELTFIRDNFNDLAKP